MTITLYNRTSASNVLYKTMTPVGTNITATAKGPVNVDQLNLVLDYTSMDFNYLYISDFGRYYDVQGRTLMPGGFIMVTAVSDPLESFNSEVANLDVLVVRAEDAAMRSPYLTDNAIPMYCDIQIDKITGDTIFGSGEGSYVLGVV